MSNCVFVDGNAAHPDPWCSTHKRSAICCFRDADKAAWQALRERNAARAEVERLDNIRKGLLESLFDHARGRGNELEEIGRLQAEVARLKYLTCRMCRGSGSDEYGAECSDCDGRGFDAQRLKGEKGET